MNRMTVASRTDGRSARRPLYRLLVALALLALMAAPGFGSPDCDFSALQARSRRKVRHSGQRGRDAAIRRSLVFVSVTPIYYDFRRPWISEPGRTYTITGVVLKGGRILVLANEVHNAGLLEVRKHSSYQKFIAKVDRLDMEVNLALLRVEDRTFFSDLRPLPIGAMPRPGEQAQAVKIDDVFRVSRERVTVTGVELVADFGFTHTPVAVFNPNENYNAGGLLVRRGKMCGFLRTSTGERTVEALGATTLELFRRRAARKHYSGFVSQGFELVDMVDPVLREYYGLSGKNQGPLVNRVLPGTSAWKVLEKGDVLVSLAGVPLDNRGYYDDPRFGRQQADLLLAYAPSGRIRQPGSVIPLTVVRQGKRLKLRMKLIPYHGGAERIVWYLNGQPPYLVESGLVFLELSVPYLKKRYGSNWRNASIQLAHIFNTRRYYAKPDDDRIVIMAGILPDPVNRGYDSLFELPLLRINHQPVQNLKEMYRRIVTLSGQGEKNLILEFSGGKTVFLDLTNRDRNNQRISRRYRLPRLFYLR